MVKSELKSQDLEKAIIRVIAFFDMFDYPVTPLEIWKYLGVEFELGEVISFLDQLHPNPLLPKERGRFDSKNGFYFLKGREEIIETRLRRYNYTDEKFKRALWVSRIFKFIPWVKGIAIGNIIGAHNLKQDGDIDFFIITQKNRIWITRFYCILITKILGLRPKPGKMKDTICLSFFVSEDRLNLKGLMLSSCHSERSEESRDPSARPKDDKEKDIYFIHWLAGLVPIYDSKNIFSKFFKENDWLKKYLPNWQANEVHCKRNLGKANFMVIFDSLGGISNRFVRFIQLKMLNKKLEEIMNKDTRVIMDDQILKLHVNDRREEYRNKFLKQLSSRMLEGR